MSRQYTRSLELRSNLSASGAEMSAGEADHEQCRGERGQHDRHRLGHPTRCRDLEKLSEAAIIRNSAANSGTQFNVI